MKYFKTQHTFERATTSKLVIFAVKIIMSSIITSILSSTVGLLCNKARDATAGRLKDGDITDAKVRELIVREFNDIKTKLDALSRKELSASYTFLEEGVALLSISLDKSKLGQKAVLVEVQDGHEEMTQTPSGAECGILSQALELSHAMGKLRINSDKEFESAKKRFEEARKTATHAFCNEGLTIKDRIFAAKVRVASELLENLETPETAITGCQLFLKKLHSLPAIQEIFSVYINGGIKSILSKAERVESVKSVMLINYVLHQFVSKFRSENHFVLSWPVIELSDRKFHPILHWREIATRKSCAEELVQLPNGLLLNRNLYFNYYAVNSHGDVVTAVDDDDEFKVIPKAGDRKVVNLPDQADLNRESKVIAQKIKGLAIDKHNNIYVLIECETRTENGHFKSYPLVRVFDESYNFKRDCALLFLVPSNLKKIAIDNDGDIIIVRRNDVCVCDNDGNSKRTFEQDSTILWRDNFSISDKNEIVIASDHGKAISTYTKEGDLKSTIKLPEGHVVHKVAFHYGIGKVMALTRNKDSLFLLSFSQTGKLESTTLLGEYTRLAKIASHPSGPAVIVTKDYRFFI